jgi:hypothetical protein
MPIAEGNTQRRDEIVANNLTGDVAEHEGTKSKTLIVETPSLGKKIEAVHFGWP